MPIRLLVVTAVAAEADAVTAGLPPALAPAGVAADLPGYAVKRGPYADVLAAGVGPAAAAAGTATALTMAVAEGRPYELVVSAGIGGGFTTAAAATSATATATATIVVADAIVAADLGAQTPRSPQSPDGFTPVDELGFGTSTHRPPEKLSRAVAQALRAAHAPILTVCTVTGTAERAAELAARHPRAAAEAMEGFGVAEAAAAHGTPVLEIRAISNPVGPRDRAAWQIGRALTELADAFRGLVRVLDAWEARP